MHQMFWGLHRSSIRAIAVAKKITGAFGLTPSRFHMLVAIKSERVEWFPQRGLRVLLGVTAQTISRMVRSLVACGVLVQRVVPEDRRRRVLAFTELGRETFGRAFQEIVGAGLGKRVAGRALTDMGWPMRPAERAAVLDTFVDGMLNEPQFGLRDIASFQYTPENELPSASHTKAEGRKKEDYEDSTPDLTALDKDPD